MTNQNDSYDLVITGGRVMDPETKLDAVRKVDPKTVKDKSTMKDGGLPSTGIPYVVVNGTVVVKDNKALKGVYSGKAIRRIQ